MKRLPSFAYILAANIEEASQFLTGQMDKAKILAGGTDLLVGMKEGKGGYKYLVDLKQITELKTIKESTEGVEIGATTSLQDIVDNTLIQKNWPALAQAVGMIGSVQIRVRATIGGNISNASPSADSVPPLIAYQAMAIVWSKDGKRQIPLKDFFNGPGTNVLEPGEILYSIYIPKPNDNTSCAYFKHGPRRAMDIAVINVAALVEMDTDGVCRQARIVMGAVAPTVLLAVEAETLLLGKKLNISLLEEAALAAQAIARPISDIRSSAEYRKDMVKVFTLRALKKAAGLA